jgi:hypothetical protein
MNHSSRTDAERDRQTHDQILNASLMPIHFDIALMDNTPQTSFLGQLDASRWEGFTVLYPVSSSSQLHCSCLHVTLKLCIKYIIYRQEASRWGKHKRAIKKMGSKSINRIFHVSFHRFTIYMGFQN